MDYKNFLLDLKEIYYDIFENGLKKQANKAVFEYLKSFDLLDKKIRFEILYMFCEDFFDAKTTRIQILLIEKNDNSSTYPSNPHLTYELSKRIKNYLEIENDSMPHMRWHYQLTANIDSLDRAYSHEHCDKKTVELLFSKRIDGLYWGSHHFPDCNIISDEYEKSLFNDCESMIKKHSIPKKLQIDFYYYQELYRLYHLYGKNSHGDFDKFCEDNNLSFTKIESYYFEK